MQTWFDFFAVIFFLFFQPQREEVLSLLNVSSCFLHDIEMHALIQINLDQLRADHLAASPLLQSSRTDSTNFKAALQAIWFVFLLSFSSTCHSALVPVVYKVLHVVQDHRSKPEFVQLFGVNVAVCSKRIILFHHFSAC
jgi:hypothetical protein